MSAGSIVVTSTTTFLDGSQAGANAFASTIGSSTAASSLFPAATYGTVTSTAKVQLVANAGKSVLNDDDVPCNMHAVMQWQPDRFNMLARSTCLLVADKSSGLSRHWSAVVILISSAGILIMA